MKASYTLLFVAALLPGLAHAWPWSQDMMNQLSVKPEEIPPGRDSMMPFPERSVPIQGIPTKVNNLEEASTLINPTAVTEASLKNGRTLYRIICAACHGLGGKGVDDPIDSPVAEKIGAANLITEYVQQQLTEGWIFGTITFGSASTLMPAYGVTNGDAGSNDLTPEERWDVVNYVRHGLVKEVSPTQQVAVP